LATGLPAQAKKEQKKSTKEIGSSFFIDKRKIRETIGGNKVRISSGLDENYAIGKNAFSPIASKSSNEVARRKPIHFHRTSSETILVFKRESAALEKGESIYS